MSLEHLNQFLKLFFAVLDKQTDYLNQIASHLPEKYQTRSLYHRAYIRLAHLLGYQLLILERRSYGPVSIILLGTAPSMVSFITKKQ